MPCPFPKSQLRRPKSQDMPKKWGLCLVRGLEEARPLVLLPLQAPSILLLPELQD